jgi:hypothetical protein
VKLSPDVVDISNLAKDVIAQIGTNRRLIEAYKRIGTLLEEVDRENFTKRESLFREVQVELEGLQASFTEIIEVALDPEGDSALGIAIQQLRAAMGGSSAEINVRWDVSAAPSGFSARYVIQLRETGGAERQVNMFLDLPEDPTKPGRIGFMAGQTVFFTSGGVPLVILDEDGVQRSANNAVMINWVTGAMRNDAV